MPDNSNARWLVERGIGEDRAMLVEGEKVLATRLRWPDELYAGQVIPAKLARKPGGTNRGLAVSDDGREILIDRIPEGATEGATLSVRIVRAPLAERGRLKLAQGRIETADGSSAPAEDDPFGDGEPVRSFPKGLWEDVWQAAAEGQIAFPGGNLVFSVTPAMTLIDIDGDLPPRDLAMAAVPAIARSLRLFDLGGSIGIDFPTLPAKADRKAVDTALEEALNGFAHERTAMNGFGFVQIVARLEGPSLLHRLAASRTGACLRMALRQAELVEGTGRILVLTIHPALKASLLPEWLAELERRTGREVRIETDAGLALEAAHAQLVQQ